MPGTVPERVDALPLVDHHCHGVLATDPDRATFEELISEGGAAGPGRTTFDTPIGLALRRHCSPLLDLPAHASPEDYLARRAELGGAEVTRRMLAGTGTAHYLVDTGFHGERLTPPAELAAVTGAASSEIVRLEAVAERLADAGAEGSELLPAVAAELAEAAAAGAVGVKSIAAYRVGLDLDPDRPGHTETVAAAARWLAAGPGERGHRLADPVLTRALLWTAVDLGLPIQLHVGFGDADIRMSRVDPTLLTDWLHRHRVPVMLLHCWPYHRQAAYLAAVFPHVYLDLGLTTQYVGPWRVRAVLEEALEVAPFDRVLYSSDAHGVAEHYHLAALGLRRALGSLLADRVADGEWAEADAVRVAAALTSGNAARAYRIPDPAAAR